jgi:hypothetical protein
VSVPETIPCRWKHLRGEGRKAMYRATCGRGKCRGHLGDLRFQGSYEDAAADVLEEYRRDRSRLEQGIARGEHPSRGGRSADEELARLVSREETAQRHLQEAAADERAGRVNAQQEWRMSALPCLGQFVYSDDYPTPIYYGHADSGFRISFRRKYSRSGNEIGRRPMYPADHRSPGWMTEVYGAGRHGLKGQRVLPTDRVWCPVCGTLNQLEWPEQLKDAQPQ